MSARDTLSVLAEQIALAFQPIADAFQSTGALRDFLEDLGWDFNAPPPALNALQAPVQNLFALVDKPDGLNPADLPTLITNVRAAFQGISQLESAAGLAADFRDEFPRQLVDYIVVEYLLNNRPRVGYALMALGITTLEERAAAPPRPGYWLRRFEWEQLSQLLHDPLASLKSSYRWGQSNFDVDRLVQSLGGLLEGFDLDVRIGLLNETTGASLNQGALHPDAITDMVLRLVLVESAIDAAQLNAGVGLFQLPETASAKPGFALLPFATAGLDEEFALSDQLSLSIGGNLDLTGGAGILVRPNQDVAFLLGFDSGASAPATGNLTVSLRLTSTGEPFTLLGDPDASRIEVAGFSTTAGTRLGANGKLAVFAEFALQQGKIVIKPGAEDSDGFLAKLLPADGFTLDANLTIGTSSDRGLYFSGSGGLEITLPLHINLGPVEIQSALIAVKPSDGAIEVDLAASVKGELGPITAVVQNVGLKALFSFPPKRDGNLGPVQLDLGFRPPDGVGLSVDAGVIKGGGFLSIRDNEYVGALELTFQDLIALKAIAIINTKLPDGTPGFALLILVTAEFVPIQLGFGFTLIGVGGLLALNRRLDTEALRVGVRTGALNSVLFPQDIIANITRIISDIKDIFPIAADHFVLGPMGKLGWGTPTLLSLEIGVIIDLPTPAIVIAGVLQASLPAEDLPILHLQVNFAGGVDFQKGLIWFDASLYDSHLLIYTLTGDMALRIGWGDQAIFILTVGGFHPSFSEIPPDLRNLRRLGISLLSGDNPRLTCATYFAITSNTVQSGARVELYAEGCGLNIYGFLGYDLLVQFNPFHFIADLDAGLALRDGTDELMGIHVHGELSGPNPFRARGEASIDLFLFSISIDFDVTWGDAAAPQIEAEVEVQPLIEDALKDDRNWLATLPANTHQNVTLKKLELPPEQIVMSPFAVLSVSQKIVPLGLEINKFGNQKPKGTTRFDLTSADGATDEVREEFAIANFQHLSDDEKLARKSFEQMRSGLRFSTGDSSQTGANVDKDVTYELSYVHRKRGLTIRAGLVRLFGSVFSMFSGAGAVTKNKFAVSRRIGGTPIAKVDVEEPEFHVVNGADLTLHGEGLSAKSEAEAWQLHDELVAADPSLQGRLQIMSSYELSEAA